MVSNDSQRSSTRVKLREEYGLIRKFTNKFGYVTGICRFMAFAESVVIATAIIAHSFYCRLQYSTLLPELSLRLQNTKVLTALHLLPFLSPFKMFSYKEKKINPLTMQ